jgi:hypothetical protein
MVEIRRHSNVTVRHEGSGRGSSSLKEYTRLSLREVEITTLLAKGVPRLNLGDSLLPPVRDSGVKTAINSLFSKLDAHSIPQLVVRAVDSGKIDLEEVTAEMDLSVYARLHPAIRHALDAALTRLRSTEETSGQRLRHDAFPGLEPAYEALEIRELPAILCGYLAWKAHQAV